MDKDASLESQPLEHKLAAILRYEWTKQVDVLGIGLLARLLNVHATSIQRYRSGERSTPDEVAARLHFLALVVGDLAGAYNEIGIRRWFDRPRAALGNRTPAQVLGNNWQPDDTGAKQVRELAASLVAMSAT